jgi:RNA polymerase sigma-70 factor (ECF subfamily)
MLATMKLPTMHPEAPTPSDIDYFTSRAQEGDNAAFESLYRVTVGPVYGLCLRMTANPTLADECTQNTFVQAWQKLDEFRGESKFSTWLHRIAVNEVLGTGRREGRYRVVVDDFGVNAELHQAFAGSPDVDLERAIAELPERARQVFVLHAVYGHKHEEIGELLDMAIGTSKSHYHRARHLLQQALGDSHV